MTIDVCSWPKLLDSILDKNDLSKQQAEELMMAWLNEDLAPAQTGAFLAGLRAKGVTGTELGSMANVLRLACKLPCSLPSLSMVDTCGTGGDGADTFNISTAVAFLAASCGVNIAKHGNRSASGSVGSADVLESLGLNLSAPLTKVVEAIEETKVTFLFAPAWHPSLVNLAPIRRTLGIRSVFNLLGPLVNPLKPKAQVLGVAKEALLDPMAEALNKIELDRGIVVYGSGGLDEASLEGTNQVRFLENGVIRSEDLNPLELGLDLFSNDYLKGGSIEVNKQIFSSVLKGNGAKHQNQVLALNNALVLWAAGAETDLKKGVQLSLESLLSGKPWKIFEELKLFLDS